MHLTLHLPSYLTIAGYRVLRGPNAHILRLWRGRALISGMPRAPGHWDWEERSKCNHVRVRCDIHCHTPGGKMVDMNTSAGHNDTHSDNVYKPTTASVPVRDTDTSATEHEPSMTLNMDTTPVLADEIADGSLGTPHLDDGRGEEGSTTADLPHKDHHSRRKSGKQTQDVAAGSSSMVPPLTDKASRNDNEDTSMDDDDTSSTPVTTEDTQEELRHSHKRTKKLKIEKTGEHHSERSRTLPKRAPCKSGKP